MNQTRSQEINREELYEKVWTTPMRTLAKKYGISDVGLAKACKRHNIPRPERGFWARMAAGKVDPRASLPAVDDPLKETVILNPTPIAGLDRIESEHLQRELKPENRITVPNKVSRFHPKVAATKTALRTAPSESEGILWTRERKALPLQVTKATLPRALRIMNALILALEARGYSLQTKENYRGKLLMNAVVEDEWIEFGLDEPFQRDLELEEREAKRFNYRDDMWKTRQYSGTGTLRLEILEYSGDGMRKRWRDGKNQRVEDGLNSFIVSCIRLAEKNKTKRRQEEEDEQRRRDWEEKREKKLRQIQEEELRIKALIQSVDSWSLAQRLRNYLKIVRDDPEASRRAIPKKQDPIAWLAWAHQQADRLDPLVPNPSSILDEKGNWENESSYLDHLAVSHKQFPFSQQPLPPEYL